MDTEDVKYIKKKTCVNGIEAHPTEDAVIVTYQIDASLVGDLGNSLLSESKQCQKMFRIVNIDKVKDVDILSLELIKRSEKLISYVQVEEVRQILMYLISRKDTVNDSVAKMENLRPRTAQLKGSSSKQEESEEAEKRLLNRSFWSEFSTLGNEAASINNLDEYVEKLYEDIPSKINGAGMVLKLCQCSDNLDEMASNETLLCALTRVLREDGRKSVELSTLIIAIFATFSDFSTFHEMITHYKIGSQTIDLIQYEISKHEWQETLASTNSHLASRSLDSPVPVKEKSSKKYHNLILKQNQMLRVSFHLLLNLSEDPKLEQKMIHKGILDQLVKSLEREADIDLFLIVLKFLLKLSIYIENKNVLAEKAIMEKLFVLFSFTSKSSEINQEFMSGILSLVYNLSFDLKIIKNMIQVGMVSKLFLFWCRNRVAIKRVLEQLILKILYQVSREPRFRRAFDFSPSIGIESIDLFMTKVMRTLEISASGRPVTGRNVKSLCLTELMALAINLSLDSKIAIRMANDGKLSSLVKHVYGNREVNHPVDLTTVYVVKFIRNLSNHSHEFKNQFVPFIENISATVFSVENVSTVGSGRKESQPESRRSRKEGSGSSTDDMKQTLLTESATILGDDMRQTLQTESATILGDDMRQTLLTESVAILGNLNDPNLNIDWFPVLEKFHAFDWLMSKLSTKSDCEDDLVLEVIIFLGTVCQEEKSASLFVSNQGMDLVTEVLDKLQEDDEIVLQTLYLIHVIAEHSILKQEMTSNSKLSSLLLELMNDGNGEIRNLASATLDIFSSSHQVWANKVRMESFRSHNQQWLQMIQSANSDDLFDDPFGELLLEEESDQEVELNDVLRAELFNSSLDSSQDSKSASPPNSHGHSEGTRPKTAQRPVTGYGRR